MAVISISRLQHRRGLKADLPTSLNEAELGWCLDTKELYIGNGNAWTGNSQILTEYGPNDQLITHVYSGYSGSQANTSLQNVPTVRTLDSILNDYLCVKDYGAVGDGVTDDTQAIQDAIDDEWARISNDPAGLYQSRNTIYFPAGTYVVSSAILLYPYITLAGEGQDRTAIQLSELTGPVLRTADSLGQTGANIGNNEAVLPTSITVRGMNIDGSNLQTDQCVLLQRCTDVNFVDCKIIGSWAHAQSTVGSPAGLVIETLGTVIPSNFITISACRFINVTYAIYSSDPITNLRINNCAIDTCYQGIALLQGSPTGPSNIQIIANNISNTDSYGLYVTSSGPGITSMANMFSNSGAYTAVPSMYFDAQAVYCASIGDVFDQANPALNIHNGNPGQNLLWNQQKPGLVNNQPLPFLGVLNAGATNANSNIMIPLTYATNMLCATIDYAVSQGTYRATGQLRLISDLATVHIDDSRTQLNSSVTLTFGAIISGSDVIVTYTTNGGSAGQLTWIQTYWYT
jgi:Pectate lyase superfamily protein/Major tropism determinant N-terminal domain